MNDTPSCTPAASGRSAGRLDALAAILAQVRHGIMLWSTDKHLLVGNGVAAAMLGHGIAITPGLHHDDFARHLHAAGLLGAGADADALLRSLLAHDGTGTLTLQARHGGIGKEADAVMEIHSAPAADIGFVTTLVDITEAQRAEAVLAQANAAAAAAAASKARFLATMSHELRTPLNAIIGYSDAIHRDRGGTDPSVTREYAEEINDAGKRLLLLINTLLDVARIEAGRFDLTTDRIDVTRLVPSVIRQSRSAATAGEITVDSEISPGIPQLRGDERRMQQVLGNLVSNAIKFTEPGGSATIAAEIDAAGDVLISVRDTGIGIAEENLDRVFEPFTQLDPGADRQFEGSGLGLYVARALVEAHGGTLALRSRPGEGTTAEIRLPARRVVDAPAPR